MMPPDRRRLIAVDRAARRYASAVRQGSIPCRADGDSASQTDNFRAGAERAELRFAQVKQVLMELGVPLIQFVPYRNFALHLDKLCRDYADETLRQLALVALARWVEYGLNQKVLRAVCREVFGLEVD